MLCCVMSSCNLFPDFWLFNAINAYKLNHIVPRGRHMSQKGTWKTIFMQLFLNVFNEVNPVYAISFLGLFLKHR